MQWCNGTLTSMSTRALMQAQSISPIALLLAPEQFHTTIDTREQAAATLEHAMAYLILGRFKRPRADKQANRQAVRILCDARDVLDYTSS